ncbi:MAG: two-component regulator propeller domain-containing protein [Bacteroidia bacterium]
MRLTENRLFPQGGGLVFLRFVDSILYEAVLLALLLLVCPAFFAQNIQFERIPNELGLSQNYISALCQDRAGFIWVGTKDGLNRFDGYNFKTFIYDPFDSLSISNNFIYSLLEDSEDRLWVEVRKRSWCTALRLLASFFTRVKTFRPPLV